MVLLLSYDSIGRTVTSLTGKWGRIDTNGQELVEAFSSGIEARTGLKAVAPTKRLRGYRAL
ncbi:WGR domain-containing protein [Microvirga aerophila]